MPDQKILPPNTSSLPKIGVEDQSLPEPLTQSSDEEGSSWWNTQKSVPGPNRSGDPSSKKWRTVASEEIEKFRPVPVVGRLPWRVQYILGSFVFLTSLVVLLFSASALLKTVPQDGNIAVRNAVFTTESGIEKALSGQPFDANRQKQVLSSAQKVQGGLPSSVQKNWSAIAQMSNQIPQWQQDASAVVEASNQAQAIIGETLTGVMPHWRQAGESGQWNSVDAVNFAQMLAEWQYLQEATKNWSQGKGDISTRFTTARQNIDQAIRVFASSPSASQQNNLTQAWRVAAAGFIKLRPQLDAIAGRSSSWNNLLGAQEIVRTQKIPLLEALGGSSSMPSTKKYQKMLGVSGTIVFLSLLLLSWISLKQHQWHLLHAKMPFEQLQAGVDDISKQLRKVSSGDLTTKIRPVDPLVQPIADLFNSTIKKLRFLVTDVQQTAETATLSANNASETTGELVSLSWAHVEMFSKNIEDTLSISAAIQQVADWANDASSMSEETFDSVNIGQAAVEDAAHHINGIREKSEEGLSRTQNLNRSFAEIQFMANLLYEISGQMDILAIQAAIQATKAGESGQGFRVVADALKSLSEKSSEGSRRVTSLVETALADIATVGEAMEEITQKTDEGARLSDVSLESALLVRERLLGLKEKIDEITTISTSQSEISEKLSDRTSSSATSMEEQTQKAQFAADGILELLEAVRALKENTGKIKV